jgi:hypothetical protein
VQAIGIAKSSEDQDIEWFESCGCSETNKKVEFPKVIGGHLSFEASLLQPSQEYAYCVQLPCGRTFVINQSLSDGDFYKLKKKSVKSRLTRGKAGFEKSYAHLKRYGVK